MKRAYLIIVLFLFSLKLMSQDSQFNPEGLVSKKGGSSRIFFRENKGQVSDQNSKPREDILYSGNIGNMVYHLKQDGINYQLSRVDKWGEEKGKGDKNIKVPLESTLYRLDINWLGANPTPEIEATKPLAVYDNFYLPSCPDGALFVKSYEQITYKKIYQGIDLVFHNKEDVLHYDFVVQPGADYQIIKIQIKGAQRIEKTANGEIKIKTPLGDIVEGKPVVYQKGKKLAAKWVISGKQLSFAIEDVDPSYELIIDPPVRNWGTYFGGSRNEGQDRSDNTADRFGNIYLFGDTQSPDNIATVGAVQTALSGNANSNFYIAKFDNNGSRQWATYYGGTGSDFSSKCTTDLNGNVYFCGSSSSSDLSTSLGAHQTAIGGSLDAFLVKLNTNGVRLWATFYGGVRSEGSPDCTTDRNGNIYLCGSTSSYNFIPNTMSTSNSHQPIYGSSTTESDAYLVKFDSSGTRLWGTYYGGTDFDNGSSCSTDSYGNVYLTGKSYSSNAITTPNSYQSTMIGYGDMFLAKFTPSGSRLWSTYFGGTGNDVMRDCQTDLFNNIYITGRTKSTTSISTPGSNQPLLAGDYDAFLAKFDSTGNRVWSTYYGTADEEEARSVSTNSFGDVFIAGTIHVSVWGTDTISTPNAHQTKPGGGIIDAFLAKFDNNGNMYWSTYYGGESQDAGTSCSSSNDGYIYLSGHTLSSNDIATPNSHQSNVGFGPGSMIDNYLVQFCDTTPSISSIIFGPKTICKNTQNILFYINYNTNNLTWTVPSGATIIAGQGTDSIIVNFGTNGGNISVTAQNDCGVSAPKILPITINTIIPSPIVSPLSDTICIGDSITLTVGGGTSYLWNTGDTSSSITVSPILDSNYIVTVTENSCDSIPPPLAIFVNPVFMATDSTYICEGDSVLIFGKYQSLAGIYYDSLQTILGCDSVIANRLIEIPIVTETATASVCNGDSILLGGNYQTSSGAYNDTLQTTIGCDSILITTLTINPISSVNDSIHICKGDSVLLQGKFQISNGVYYDTLNTTLGCDSVMTTALEVTDIPLAPIVSDTSFCLNQVIPSLTVTGSGLGNFSWYADSNGAALINSSSSYTPNINKEGQYKFYILETINGCPGPLAVLNVDVYNPIAVINATPAAGLAPLEVSFGNGSSNANWYDWDFGTGDTSSIFEPSYLFVNEGTYKVTLVVSDIFGCIDSNQVTINVEYVVSIPNTITPNSDGFNDLWIIDNIEQFPDHIIQVFNRNGSSVFEAENYQNDWDGQYNGGDLPATTYYYLIDLGVGKGVLKGDLSIIREK